MNIKLGWLCILLSVFLTACGALKVNLSVLDLDGQKVKVVKNRNAQNLAKVTAGKSYQLLAEASSDDYVSEVVIQVPQERIASGTGQTSRNPPNSKLLFAQANIKPLKQGESFPISASARALSNGSTVSAQSENIIVVSGDIKPEINDLAATPIPVEVNQTVTLNWKVKNADAQELTVTGINGKTSLSGTANSMTFKPVKAGINTVTLKAFSVTDTSVTKSINIDVLPPVQCELIRPKDQKLEIQGINGNRNFVAVNLEGGYNPSTRTRTAYIEALTTEKDKAQAVVHQIVAHISFDLTRVEREVHNLLIFDLRRCNGYQTVTLGDGLSVGDLHLAKQGHRNWVMFTTIKWSGRTASQFQQTVRAHFQELSTQQAAQHQRVIQLSGIPYNNGSTSIFMNGSKDRAVIYAMGNRSGNVSVQPYNLYSFDFTKLGNRYPLAGEIRVTCPIARSGICINLDPPEASPGGSAKYPKPEAESSTNTEYQYNPNIPRYKYNFSKAITKFEINGDDLKVEAWGTVNNNHIIYKGAAKLK